MYTHLVRSASVLAPSSWSWRSSMALLMESICLKGHRGMPSLRQSLFIICEGSMRQLFHIGHERRRRAKKISSPVLVGQ